MKFKRFFLALTGILVLLTQAALADDDGYEDAAPSVDDYSSYPIEGDSAQIAPPQVPMDDGQYDDQ